MSLRTDGDGSPAGFIRKWSNVYFRTVSFRISLFDPALKSQR